MSTLRLDQEEARHIAIRAQLLDAARPTDLLELVRQLTFLQVDPTAAVAPSADLIPWSRMGSTYQPEQLRQAIERDRTLFEYKEQGIALIRPTSDLGLYLDAMKASPVHEGPRRWLAANEAFRQDVLGRLRDAGPLLSRDVRDTSAVPWASTGWTNNQNVTRMLEILAARGEVATAGRIGRQRLWDIAERVHPAGNIAVPEAEAAIIRDQRRLRSLGISRRAIVGEAGVPAAVDGSTLEYGSTLEWRVDPDAVGKPFTGRTALLSPFDQLIHDRIRAKELFGFEYVLEMYKPAAARRWGYFALPILHSDRLIGKLDAVADRKAGTFQVNAIHEDAPFSPTEADAVRAELEELAAWLGLVLSSA